MAVIGLRFIGTASLGVAAAAILACTPAAAQTMNANSAAYNAGYGRTAGQENQPINVGNRDANGNLTIINGVITSSAIGGSLSSGAGSAFAGAGAGGSSSATAIGNSLTVITQGDNNVVIVDSKQVNTGTVTASQTGGSNNDGS